MSPDIFSPRQLAWVDRSGKVLGTIGPPLPSLCQPRLSPDGQRIAVSSGESAGSLDLWLIDVATGGPVPFTRSEQPDSDPFWWNGGETIIFQRTVQTGNQVVAKSIDATSSEQHIIDGSLADASRSGKYLLVRERGTDGKSKLAYVEMAREPRVSVAFPEAFQKRGGRPTLSADDRILAWASIESGKVEVYAVDFPGFTNKMLVSRGQGGHQPVWHPNRMELFFLTADSRSLMSAKIRMDGRGVEEPAKVLDLPESIEGGSSYWPGLYDVAPDGERFLMLQKAEESVSGMTVKPNARMVQNWFDEFRNKK